MIIKTSGNAPCSHNDRDSWDEYAQKALHDIKKIISSHKPKTILIVGHGTIINLLGILFVPEAQAILQKTSFFHSEGFCLKEGKVRIIPVPV